MGNVNADGVSDVKIWNLNRKSGTWEYESSLVRPQNGQSCNQFTDCFAGMLDLSNGDIHNIAWIYLDSSGRYWL